MININKCAHFLHKNRLDHRVVENIPESLCPQSVDEAYMVQERLVSLMREQHGSHAVGYKLACTNQRVIDLLGVEGPLSGRMLSHSTHHSNAELIADGFNLRIVELEFAFMLGRDVIVSERPYDAVSIAPFIDSFRPAIEIVDHHFVDFTRVGGNALAADNAIHGASVIGAPISSWRNLDLSQHPVTLTINGAPFAHGTGKNVLGSPLNAMAWLANHLQSRGALLMSGDLVTAGTACEIYNAQKNDRIIADFGELGSVSARFV